VESAGESGRSWRPRRARARARPGGRGVAAALGVAVAAAAAVVLLNGGDDEPSAARAAPLAVSALEAEMRLELRFGGSSDDETAAVRCPRDIERGRIIRCELRYADGIARAMLVRLSPRGELEADVPYPATLRR
jgi:hypothetical protein